MRKIKLAFATALLLCVTSVWAASSPLGMLQGVSKSVLNALEKNKTRLHSSSVVYRIVNRYLVPHIDQTRMARMVVGRRYWAAASKSQQNAFVKAFRVLIISTYASAFSSYDRDKIRFYPLRRSAGRRTVVVNSVIVRKSGQTIPLSYNLIRSGSGWKVYDFSVENVSIVNSYRSQFAGTLSSGGLASLTKQIRSRRRRR